jgi:hypothetical protein
MKETLDKYKRYGIKKSILEGYSDEVPFIDFNEDDPDLDTIRVHLPKTPNWNEIDGFGKPVKEQKFTRQQVPSKLQALQEIQDDDGEFLTQDEIWAKIDEDVEYYAEEIKWIKLQWKRVLSGYWFFNNGKATYIDGWNYFYLNFYNLDHGPPEYRDRDRRFFIFARYCYNDPNCYGFVYPKHRREGATYKTSCIHYLIISMLNNARGGIQSMTDVSAKDVFSKHIIDPWRRMPFFFRPNHNGGDDPKTLLSFRASSSRGKKGIKARSGKTLDSEISFRSSGETAYDGTKLYFYHHEEIGKLVEGNVVERWNIAKLTLSTGAGRNIHGFTIQTSTVGEMEAGGGENFRELCDNSMYGERNANGQTASGLYILFMPAYDGLEGFVDGYGMSIIDEPTEEQLYYTKEKIGARQYIENQIEYLSRKTDKTDLLAFQRQHPTTYRGCFRTNQRNPFFNIPLIEERLDQLRDDKTMMIRGNFEWLGEPYRSKVKFVEDPNGRFRISKLLHGNESNKFFWNAEFESWEPLNLGFCAGADTFKSNKVKSKKKSDGAGAVFWGHDILLDPHDKNVELWQSNRFVCTYSNRLPTKEDYGDDMIMMCLYYGCPMFPETNVPFVTEHFEKLGFDRFLVRWNERGKYDTIAGKDTTVKLKQRIFNEYRTYIQRHGMRERHSDLLVEIRDIKDIDDMTNYDLFAAGGFALIGNLNYWPDVQKDNLQQDDENNLTFVQEIIY